MASKRKAYSFENKKEVLEWIINEGNCIPTRAASKFNLPPGTVRSWWKEREAILNATDTNKKRFRVSGGGSKGIIVAFDDEIIELIAYLRTQKERVTRQTVKDIAKSIAHREHLDDFKASDGWLTRFMERSNLSFRRATKREKLSDEKLLQRAFDYMKFLQNVRLRSQVANTILVDETAVYLEDPLRPTTEPTESKCMLLNTTGFASMRITVSLAVRANGEKVPPLVILKGNGASIIKKEGLWAVHQSKAWANPRLLKSWIQMVFPPMLDTPCKLLVWDSCRSHITKDLKEFMKREGISSAVIPGCLAEYVQAGDIGINKSFKDKISNLINEWKTSGNVQFTEEGTPKPPDDKTVCDWVKTAWGNVENDVIQKSLVRAGFHDDYKEWQISTHEVFGQRFRKMWTSNSADRVEEFQLQEGEDDECFFLDDDEEAQDLKDTI